MVSTESKVFGQAPPPPVVDDQKKKKKRRNKKKRNNTNQNFALTSANDTDISTVNEDSGSFSVSSLQQSFNEAVPVSSAASAATKLSVIETKKRNFQECKKDLLQNLQVVGVEIEKKVVEKEEEYESHKRNVSQMIEVQASEMSSIIKGTR